MWTDNSGTRRWSVGGPMYDGVASGIYACNVLEAAENLFGASIS